MGHSVQFWGALDEFGLGFGALWVNFEALLVGFWGTLGEFWGALGEFGLDFGALWVNFGALCSILGHFG